MLEVSLIGAIKKTVQIPTCWGEVSLSQFYQLQKLTTDEFIDVAPILTGIDKDVLLNCSDSDIDKKIFPAIQWIGDKDNQIDAHDNFVPDTLELNGKIFSVPKEIRFETYAQKLAIERVLRKNTEENQISIYADILAIYLYPSYTGEKFDERKAIEFKEEILKLQLKYAFPIAAFFLTNLEGYLISSQENYNISLHKLKKAQESSVLKSSENFQHFSRFRKLLGVLWMKFYKKNMPKSSESLRTMQRKQGFNGSYTIK